MTYFDINKFVTDEVLPTVNELVKTYLEITYSYIDNFDDLQDLEFAEVNDELLDDVKKSLKNLIVECDGDYDFSKVDDKELNDDLLFEIVDSAFTDYKDILIEKYNEEFDKIDYFDEYYTEENEF